MSLLGSLHLTLSDHIKRLTPDGAVARDIVEISEQFNPILQYIPFIEGNLSTGNRAIIRTDMPGVAWVALGQPVIPGKSGTKQVDDTTATAKALCHIPIDIAALNGNTAAFRLSEQIPFIEVMNQEMASALFYANSALDPLEPLGLAPRYNTLATSGVYDAGGRSASSVTSMWLMCVSTQTFYGIFPKGSQAGIQHIPDAAPLTVGDDLAGYVKVYQDEYRMNLGFQLKDWRYVRRLANIATTGSTAIIDPEIMNQMYRAIPNPNMGRMIWVCNRTVATQLDNLAMNKTNVLFTVGEEFGRTVTKFKNAPIIVNDAILDTEDVLS